MADHSCRMISASSNFCCLNKEWISRFLTLDSVVPVALFCAEELDEVEEDVDDADDGTGLAESVTRLALDSEPFNNFNSWWQSSATMLYSLSSKQHSVRP